MSCYDIVRAKWKGVSEHAQNVSIHIHLAHAQSIIWDFVLQLYIL